MIVQMMLHCIMKQDKPVVACIAQNQCKINDLLHQLKCMMNCGDAYGIRSIKADFDAALHRDRKGQMA